MKRLIAALLLCALPLASAARQQPQPPRPGAEQREKMKSLDFLAGRWKGEGWIALGPGRRGEFVIEETVQGRLGGLVVLIEGLGRTKGGANDGAVSHNALATVAYDEAAGQFRFRAYQMEGRYVDSEARVGDRSLEWGFDDARGGRVRFTIRVNDAGQWVEVGEYTRDAKTWQKFFEMTLRRAK